MIKSIKPFIYYEEDEGDGQDNTGSDGEGNQELNGQEEAVTELMKKFDNLYKTVSKFASEQGYVREAIDKVATFDERFQSLEEKLSKAQTDDEIDLFDPEQQKQFIASVIQENLKPLQEAQQQFITTESFQTLIEQAQRAALLKDEFSLSDDEVQKLTTEASEKNISLRELAYDKYAERKFKKTQKSKLTKELSNELNNDNNNQPPPESSTETVFDKIGVPSDPAEFEKMYKEKGAEAMKEMLIKAGGKT